MDPGSTSDLQRVHDLVDRLSVESLPIVLNLLELIVEPTRDLSALDIGKDEPSQKRPTTKQGWDLYKKLRQRRSSKSRDEIASELDVSLGRVSHFKSLYEAIASDGIHPLFVKLIEMHMDRNQKDHPISFDKLGKKEWLGYLSDRRFLKYPERKVNFDRREQIEILNLAVERYCSRVGSATVSDVQSIEERDQDRIFKKLQWGDVSGAIRSVSKLTLGTSANPGW